MSAGTKTTAVMNSIDIDVGGTFTDFVLTLDGERTIVKSPTTPHCYHRRQSRPPATRCLASESLLRSSALLSRWAKSVAKPR